MKKIIFATLALLLVFAPGVSAHTGLTSSSPADGDHITVDVNEVFLEFNTKIETTSTVKVLNDKQEEIEIGDTQISDNTITGMFTAPLNNGTYKLDWKIIGADGHPTQGSYSFEIDKGKEIAPVDKEEAPVTPIEEQEVIDSSKIASNDVLVVILVLLFTVAGGFVGWMIGRGKRK